jgi:hypothetical protein
MGFDKTNLGKSIITTRYQSQYDSNISSLFHVTIDLTFLTIVWWSFTFYLLRIKSQANKDTPCP